MARLKKTSRLSLLFSLLLLLVTYGAEGWIYGSWIKGLPENFLGLATELTRFGILYGVAVAGILLLVVVFTSPVSLMTVGLDNWLKSDTRAFLSIFIGAFAFAILVQRVDYFARLLILISAVFLLKLDLQLQGYNRWLCSFILMILCCLGFSAGILASYPTELLTQ